MDFKQTAASAAAALALGGCANFNAVKHDFSTAGSAAVSIDAKQRAIYSVHVDNGHGRRDVVCAEPSPDALSALAASLGLDAAGAVKSLGLAFSTQEGAASIGLRTQTIQTLRDAMYRLCEGYAGGALDDVGFVRLQRRYQGVMLGLLAIEQLTGATVASQATLGGNSGARLGNSLGKVSSLVTEARQKQVAAQADLTAKKATQAAKAAEVTATEAALKKANEEAKGQETQAVKDAKAAHLARSEELEAANAALAKSQQADAVAKGDLDSLEQLRKELDRASVLVGTGAQLGGVSNAAAGPGDSQGVKRVAEAVETIVTAIVKHDYSLEACSDWILSRNVQDYFAKTDDKTLRLLQIQFEMCNADRNFARDAQDAKRSHEIELARINAAHQLEMAKVKARSSVCGEACAVAVATAPLTPPEKPKPAPARPKPPRKTVPTPSAPAASASAAPAPKAAASAPASATTPAASAPAPASAAASAPTPAPVVQPRPSAEDRIRNILK